MARLARIVVPRVAHHITQRGNRRQQVFFREEDYEAYLPLMAQWCRKCGAEIWAYCLMPNHVHLIAVPASEESLARGIGEAHRRYTRMINFRENWRGYLWQGRFASFPMDDKHLLVAARYVELNPVRAGLAQSAGEYEWSSAAAHLRGEDDILVKVSGLSEMIGNWNDFLGQGLEERELDLLRRHGRTGRPLGSDKFIMRLERRFGRNLQRAKPGPKRRR